MTALASLALIFVAGAVLGAGCEFGARAVARLKRRKPPAEPPRRWRVILISGGVRHVLDLDDSQESRCIALGVALRPQYEMRVRQ